LRPVHGVPLVDLAIERLRRHVDQVAVNAHWLHEQLEDHLADRGVHVSVEEPEALGTAGALGQLRAWIDGRDVLLTNADAWYGEPLPRLSGGGIQLLAIDTGSPADFDNWLYAGTCFMPWSVVRKLEPVPSGLYEVCWRDAWQAGDLELVPYNGRFIDCGTPDDYARARRAGGAE
jgi:N-acetyl-alpha-D-muramate 1-phosphate uridylyltransferase